MKNTYLAHRKNLIKAAVLALFICVFAAMRVQAQTTEFIYQGQLQNGGSPAAGNYDFEFLLYDALSGGNQVGATLTKSGVPVANGIFSTKLDFGSNFPGAARFIEIHVRQSGGGAFTTLAPRQAVSSMPYSVKSLNADNATTAANAINATNATTATNATNAVNAANAATAVTATTATNATQLNGQAAGFYQNAANLNSGIIDPSRLPIPLALTGTDSSHVIRGENASNADAAAGVSGRATGISGRVVGVSGESVGAGGIGAQGQATSAFGQTYGVAGISLSTDGRGVYGIAPATTGTTYGGRFESDSTSGFGVNGVANATTGQTYGVAGATFSIGGRGVYGVAVATTGETYGGRFESDSVGGIGLLGKANATTGQTYGVAGMNASTTGRAVYGFASATSGETYGGRFENDSVGGIGALGNATATTGQTYGIAGMNASTSGRAVYGLASATTGSTFGGRFENDSTGGIGAFGTANATSGVTSGIYGLSASGTGRGVFGINSATSGFSIGVYGQSNSSTGSGVYGISANGQGQGVRGDSVSGIGVLGVTSSPTGSSKAMWGDNSSSTGIGVYGVARAAVDGPNGSLSVGVEGDAVAPHSTGVFGVSSGANGTGVVGQGVTYGVFAGSNLGASGTKSFRIDHPDDPANKYLLHYSTESPEALNFYRGTIVLDSEGEAVVELPSYFAKINKDPSYTLTAVGAAMPNLHIASEIDANALKAGEKAGQNEAAPKCYFRIAGGVAGAKVSWRVEALRNDLWVRAKGAAVEVDKVGSEKGTYQHPDLYGQPAEKAMYYRPLPNRPEAIAPEPVPVPATRPVHN